MKRRTDKFTTQRPPHQLLQIQVQDDKEIVIAFEATLLSSWTPARSPILPAKLLDTTELEPGDLVRVTVRKASPVVDRKRKDGPR